MSSDLSFKLIPCRPVFKKTGILTLVGTFDHGIRFQGNNIDIYIVQQITFFLQECCIVEVLNYT